MAEGMTSTEERLAAQYVSVLGFVSRCAQAINEGNWAYLDDKVGQLDRATHTLAKTTSDIWEKVHAGGPPPRAEVVRAAVESWGRHYRAGRLLHPDELAGEGGR